MERVTRLFKQTVEVIKKPEMRILPGQLAFFFVISLIPLIALVGAIASTFSISIETITGTLQDALPGTISETLVTFISGDGLNFNMVVFFISAFFLASNGAHSIIITSNEIYKVESKDVIKRRVKAILMTFIIVGLILFLLVVPVFGNLIFGILKQYATNGRAVDILYTIYTFLKYPLTLFVIYFNIKLIYTISPDKDISSSSTTKGALFTTVVWLIATEIYSFYVGSFSRYDIFYGSISNILILFLWIYMLSYIFVLGMAFNAGDDEKKTEKKEEETDKKIETEEQQVVKTAKKSKKKDGKKNDSK